MLDRIFDLLVGFVTRDGFLEHKLSKVIQNNLSSKLFIEMFVSFGPLILFD